MKYFVLNTRGNNVTTAEARCNSLSYFCVIIAASIQDKVFHFEKIDSDSDAN